MSGVIEKAENILNSNFRDKPWSKSMVDERGGFTCFYLHKKRTEYYPYLKYAADYEIDEVNQLIKADLQCGRHIDAIIRGAYKQLQINEIWFKNWPGDKDKQKAYVAREQAKVDALLDDIQPRYPTRYNKTSQMLRRKLGYKYTGYDLANKSFVGVWEKMDFVQKKWFKVEIFIENDQLIWKNGENVSWRMSFEDLVLRKTDNHVYPAQVLDYSQSHGNVNCIKFQGEQYSRAWEKEDMSNVRWNETA